MINDFLNSLPVVGQLIQTFVGTIYYSFKVLIVTRCTVTHRAKRSKMMETS